ncbi:GGDEF domain-containing response regulator [Sedimenticola sp.]|uniref:GGDEF domain-containing response regulator n=1 Tax=Sedimenticola sp. TaxID=1940285 RepID=UPI003D0CDCDC
MSVESLSETVRPMRVLIADDERIPRTLLTRMVQGWEYETVEADSGDSAWEILNQPEPPRIAIIDWVMPKMSGVEICQDLQNRTDGPLIYTILLTSKTDEASLVYALEQGAHDFLTKPASPAELRARLLVGKRFIWADDRLNESLAQMEEMATTDALTGVANRRHFFQLAERELSRAQRNLSPVALMMIDVDHFKEINDSHGHSAGDAALCHLVSVCRLGLRRTDIIARFGGDEFVILLPDCDTETALLTATRLKEAVCTNPIPKQGKPFQLRVTIGVATTDEKRLPADTITTLLRLADEALYEAKAAGRNRIALRDQ